MLAPPPDSLLLSMRKEDSNQVGLSLRQPGSLMGRARVDIWMLSVLSASLLCTLVKYKTHRKRPAIFVTFSSNTWAYSYSLPHVFCFVCLGFQPK